MDHRLGGQQKGEGVTHLTLVLPRVPALLPPVPPALCTAVAT